MITKLGISIEKRDEIIEDIKKYFSEIHEEAIGTTKANMILEYFADRLGAYYYNQGLYDAISFMSEKTDELFGLEKPIE